MAECPLTELPEESCYHCRRRVRNQYPSFEAQFHGACATCEIPIEVGMRIREREDGRYEHAGHRG